MLPQLGQRCMGPVLSVSAPTRFGVPQPRTATLTAPHAWLGHDPAESRPAPQEYHYAVAPQQSATLWHPLNLIVSPAYAAEPVRRTPQAQVKAATSAHEVQEEKEASSLSATWERAQQDPAVAGNLLLIGALMGYGAWRAANVARRPLPKSAPITVYTDYRADRDAMLVRLKEPGILPNQKKELAGQLVNMILNQSVTYIDDLRVAKANGDKDKARQIVKSFAEDFDLLTALLDEWHIRTDDSFRDIYQKIEARFCNAEDSWFKVLPMFWLNNLNTFAVYLVYLVLMTAFDAGIAPALHHVLPSLFDCQMPTESYWKLDEFSKRLWGLFQFNFVYNFLFYSGVDGLKSKNTHGQYIGRLARLNNVIMDGMSVLGYPVLRPAQMLFDGADHLAQRAFGRHWEDLSTFAWQFSRSGVFSANKYLRRKLRGPVAQWVGLGMEILIASLGNVGNAVMLDPEKANLSLVEKLADAYENFWSITSEKTMPALWQNLLRSFGFVYINQHPRNDPATAQGLRWLYGVPSGGAYLLATTYRNIKESSLNQSIGLALGVMGLEYSLAVCSNWLRDAAGPRDAAMRFGKLVRDTIKPRSGSSQNKP